MAPGVALARMRLASRWFALPAGIVACSLVEAAPATAQAWVYVQAFDQRTGEVITDLTESEVVVREGGVIRPVLDVRPANVPTKLVVVIDNSSSAVRAFGRMQEGLRSFFDRLPPNQEVSLLTLSPPRWVVQGAIDNEEIGVGLDRLQIGGRSFRLLDGLVEATEWIAEDAGPHRPVIVLLTTTGRDQSGERNQKLDVLAERVVRQGITVHVVVMRVRTRISFPRRESLAQAVGRGLSRITGGSYEALNLGAGVEQPMADVALRITNRNRELAQQHLIRFEPAGGGRGGRVRVDVTRFGIRFVVTADGKRVE